MRSRLDTVLAYEIRTDMSVRISYAKELRCLVEVSKCVEFELASSFVPASPKFDTSFKRTEAKVFQTLVRVPTVLSLMIPCP